MMNKIWTKIGLIVAGALAAISSFLSLSTYNGETVGTFTSDGSGIPVVVAGVIVVVLAVLAIVLRKKGFNIFTGIVGIFSTLVIAGIAALGFGAVNWQNSSASLYTSSRLSFGAGLILMTISAVLVGIFSILTLVKSKEN